MNLRRLKWGFLGALLLILVAVEYARLQLSPFFDTLAGRLAMDGVILIGLLFLVGAAFTVISRMNERLEASNRELRALRKAGLDLQGELSLGVVLQKVVEQAAKLIGARYGALTVLDGKGEIDEFRTTGLSEEARRRIGPPPQGRGLLGVPLREGETLRVDDIRGDPRSAGFPPNHPPMRTLLAVPIICNTPHCGQLYVSERIDGDTFSEDDEKTLQGFAHEAAVAIDTAQVHAQLEALAVAEERLRISREMHDGMAQVLAYVNTKAQASREFLAKDRRDQAVEQLDQLAAAAREVYTDVRQGILALRLQPGPERTLKETLEEYIGAWQERCGVHTEVRIDDGLALRPEVELQVVRIVQEALANVRKHAEAERVEIDLQPIDGRLVARIRDDGRGFDPRSIGKAHFPRFGLTVMRERAQSVGGRFEIDSRPGGGTMVTADIPLGASES